MATWTTRSWRRSRPRAGIRVYNEAVTELRTLAWLLLAAVWIATPRADVAAGPARAQDRDAVPCGMTTAARIVAIGDVHGAFDRYVRILRAAGLIDENRHWAGGEAVYVQVGDLIDRGAGSRQVLDLARDLEREARDAGGRVILLLGNHEVMRMQADLRYVDAAEYASFRTPSSEDLRDRAYQVVMPRQRQAAEAAGESFDERVYRAGYLDETPLGLIEMQLAFGADGDYGGWLRRQDVIAEVNDVVFLHGGVSPAVAARGCAAIASAAREELREDMVTDPDRAGLFVDSDEGPLWYRGLVDGTATADDMTAVLDGLGASRMVVGHTVTDDRRITPRFDGRLISIDTGMLDGDWFPGGVASALEIDGGTITAIYEDSREVIVPRTRPAAIPVRDR